MQQPVIPFNYWGDVKTHNYPEHLDSDIMSAWMEEAEKGMNIVTHMYHDEAGHLLEIVKPMEISG